MRLSRRRAWLARLGIGRVYPVMLIDVIVVKVGDSQVANRPGYVAIGVNLDGERDVLGLWLGPSGGRRVSFTWCATVCATPQGSIGRRSPEPARDLHCPDRGGRRSAFRRVRRGMEAALPSDDRILGERLGGVRAVPRVPRRATQDRLHDQRDRVIERQIPSRRPPQRPFP